MPNREGFHVVGVELPREMDAALEERAQQEGTRRIVILRALAAYLGLPAPEPVRMGRPPTRPPEQRRDRRRRRDILRLQDAEPTGSEPSIPWAMREH